VPFVSTSIGLLSLVVWLYLFFARGTFWRLRSFDDDLAEHATLNEWPRVIVIVPARNEAETIGQAVASLLGQDYPGKFSIVVVDDHSEDGTSAIARQTAREKSAQPRVAIVAASALPPGWTGKVWALNEGMAQVGEDKPGLYWLTDADVVHAPDTLRRLVSRAERDKRDLVSLMVLLQAKTLPERALIPAFLFFFLKLYPPSWIADTNVPTAGAAGGCILLRREALERLGGLAAIRYEVIDDCALARAAKRNGARIWMGLTRASVSLRAYRTFAEARDMIARLAFTQLHYSAAFLLAAMAGMFLTYFAPVLLFFAHGWPPRILGLTTWLLMWLSFLPTVRFYRLSPLWAPLLTLIAAFYSYATLVSAVRYWLGRGAQWKGRAQAQRIK
jgi:hopene-associated glycosyltransferase HpnB